MTLERKDTDGREQNGGRDEIRKMLINVDKKVC